MPVSLDQVERRVHSGQGELVITDHALARWRLRIDAHTPRRRIAAYLQAAWQRKDRLFLSGRGNGGLLYRVGNALVVIQWSLGRPHVVTVLGPVSQHHISGGLSGETRRRRHN